MSLFLVNLTDSFVIQQYRAIGNAVCPPLIAALAGAVLDRCPDIAVGDDDWVQKGREIAVQLAIAATRPLPAEVPRGCLPPTQLE